MKIKKIFITLLLGIIFLTNCSFVLAVNETEEKPDDFPSISANAYVILDNKTNKILYSQNETKKMYPASTTKIMTALLVLEHCKLDEVAKASYNAVMSIPDGYSTAYIQVGEELTVEQLLYLLLIPSANDAANVLAEHVGGSVDSFVSMMNTKANELGLTNTHFTNAYGKHDENHYTTAADLATIMKNCLKDENFRKIDGSSTCKIPATNKYGARTYTSTNELIVPSYKNFYEYLTAGKTGTTTQAKQCLVASSFHDDLELLCVVLGSEKRFGDARNLFDYAYSHYSIKNIVKNKDVVSNIEVKNATPDTKSLDLLVCEDIHALINNSTPISEIKPEITLNEDISAPIEEGDVLGTAKYKVEGVEYTTNLIASHSVEKSKLLLYILCGVIVLAVLFIIVKIKKSHHR